MSRAHFLVLLVAAAVALGATNPSDARADFSPTFFTLGVAKVPGVAFDIVGAARLAPSLSDIEDPAVLRAAKASLAGNFVTLGLHSVSIASFWIVSFSDLDLDEKAGATFLLNAGADLAIGVLGLVTGIDLLLQRNAAGLTGTALGTATTWSAAVNITMGAFGVLWFLPMTVGGLIGATSAWATLPPRSPVKALALVPQGAGAAIVGRF